MCVHVFACAIVCVVAIAYIFFILNSLTAPYFIVNILSQFEFDAVSTGNTTFSKDRRTATFTVKYCKQSLGNCLRVPTA